MSRPYYHPGDEYVDPYEFEGEYSEWLAEGFHEPTDEEMDEMYSQYIASQAVCDSNRGDWLDALFKRELSNRYATC